MEEQKTNRKLEAYFKVMGLATNTKTGKPAYAGVSYVLKDVDDKVLEQELTDEQWKSFLSVTKARVTSIRNTTPEDVVSISKEEYLKDYEEQEVD